MFCNLFDSHTHSDNSFDGAHSVMFMCEEAREKGLLGIAITDHCDLDFYHEQNCALRLQQSYFEVRKARVAFDSSFVVSSGVEIGEPDEDYDLAEKVVKSQRFDFVVGSIHTVRDAQGNRSDCYYCDFSKEDPYEYLDRYFQRMLKLAAWPHYDVLGHLTYPLRYIFRDGRRDVNTKRFEEVIDECLKLAVKNGKGLEINTSGLRYDLGGTMPGLKYVRRFRELGGRIITIGSDAHRVEDIGRNIDDGMELAKAAGYSYFAFYKDREPRMMALF